MPHELWLLRHGEAVPHDSKPDAERELTARGERQAIAAGTALARLGIEFAACAASPKLRARDTARLACAELGVAPEETAALTSGFDAGDARELFLEHDDPDARVLAVGHDPDFTRVVFDLTGARVHFGKGAVAAIRLDRGHGGTLIVLLRSRELEAI
jgi:phosphohistidine phosphatase